MHGGRPRPGVRGEDAHICHHSTARQKAPRLSGPPGFADYRIREHMCRVAHRIPDRVDSPHAATPHCFGCQRNQSVSSPLVSLIAITDHRGRSIVYAPWLLCPRIKHLSQRSPRQPVRVICYRGLQKCRFINRADAKLTFSITRAHGKDVVPLDPHVLLRGMFACRNSFSDRSLTAFICRLFWGPS